LAQYAVGDLSTHQPILTLSQQQIDVKALTGFQGGRVLSLFNVLWEFVPRLAVNLSPFSAMDARKCQKTILAPPVNTCYLFDFT
jgi:hypothetical protein